MTTGQTPNYKWTIPQDDEFVRDGAKAIRTLGTAIDSSLRTVNNTADSHSHDQTDITGVVMHLPQMMAANQRVVSNTHTVQCAGGFADINLAAVLPGFRLWAVTVTNVGVESAPVSVGVANFTPPDSQFHLVVNRVDTGAPWSGPVKISWIGVGV